MHACNLARRYSANLVIVCNVFCEEILESRNRVMLKISILILALMNFVMNMDFNVNDAYTCV